MKKFRYAAILIAFVICIDIFSPNISQAATSYRVYNSLTKYYTAADAKLGRSPKGTLAPGNYYVFRIYDGMYNLTKTAGSPGAWINPSKNKKPTSTTSTKTTTKTTSTGSKLNLSALKTGSRFYLPAKVTTHINAIDAKKGVNAKGTYAAGYYYVFRIYDGMYNITKVKGSAGAWVNLSKVGQKTTTPTTTSSTVDTKVQNVLNKYSKLPIKVYYYNLATKKTASLRANTAVYGASVPKIVLVAYTQDLVQRGILSWSKPLRYTSAIYKHPESYAWGGSGTIQYENYKNKSYTLAEVMRRVIDNSDNLGANMLLHYVGYRDKADFDKFVKKVYGASKYSRTMTAKQVTLVTKYVYSQKQTKAISYMDKTDYDGTKLDVVPVNVYQKIGEWWPRYNHSTGIVKASKPYVITILSDQIENYKFKEVARAIYNAVK